MDPERWRADLRFGLTDQEAGWPAVVADIWDIDKCKCTCEWPCWLSQDGRCASRARLRKTWWAGRSRTAVTRVELGDAYEVRYSRPVWWFGHQNHRWRVSQVRASKPGQRFCGRMDNTWWHVRVCVDAKLPHEERGGRQMKTMSGLTRMPCG